MHQTTGSAAEEAKLGSAEHRKLLEFLEKHGNRRLLDPSHRAELLGDKSRGPAKVSAEALPGAKEAKQAPGAALASGSEKPGFPPQPCMSSTSKAPEGKPGEPGPLWKGVSDKAKDALIQSLGRKFVVGDNQDMDGGYAKHRPFHMFPEKQGRYAKFCLALEGAASASEVLKDAGRLSESEKTAELAEFGRTYQLFRQENPHVDMKKSLDANLAAAPPALRRHTSLWQPNKILCKKWGVKEPKPPRDGQSVDAARVSKMQQDYKKQVAKGFSDVIAALPKAAAAPTPVPVAAEAVAPPRSDGPRPPKTLFQSIFGEEDDALSLEGASVAVLS